MKINRITLISFQLPKSQHYFACLRFAFLLYFICFFLIPQNCPGQGTPQDNRNQRPKMVAPDLIGGTGWLNTTRPISLKDLRGKVVLLDFWTLCCINCIHTLPDLEKLEKKWGKELVVIGVHSPKFDNEKSTESIRKESEEKLSVFSTKNTESKKVVSQKKVPPFSASEINSSF